MSDSVRKPVDWNDPMYQDMPESKAILALLVDIRASWTDIPAEFSQAQWTAFRALAKAAAIEGIVRTRLVFNKGSKLEEYHLVGGDYVKAAPHESFRSNSLEEMRVVKARLTGEGERWAGWLLRGNADHAEGPEPVGEQTRKVRAFVLSLVWDSKPEAGVFRKMPHPEPQKEGLYVITGGGEDALSAGASDSYDAALMCFMQICRSSWSAVDYGTFSSVEEKAFERLIQAGLIEARVNAYARMRGFPSQLLLTARIRGDYHRALIKATFQEMPDWLTPDGLTRAAFGFFYEIVEARRTDEGENADKTIRETGVSLFLSIVRGMGPAGSRFGACQEQGVVKVESSEVIPLDPARPWPPIHRSQSQPLRLISLSPSGAASAMGTEPCLPENDYEYIVNVIRHGARTFEQTPETYSVHDEDGLRNTILAILNSHYKGTATGETFRKYGKTDIRIEHSDRSAFVAECKIWRGSQDATGAVDQLLGYLTWRDCKAALIFFNKGNADFTKLCESLPQALATHSSMRQDLGSQDPGEWRFVFASQEDEQRLITVHVFLFNLFSRDVG